MNISFDQVKTYLEKSHVFKSVFKHKYRNVNALLREACYVLVHTDACVEMDISTKCIDDAEDHDLLKIFSVLVVYNTFYYIVKQNVSDSYAFGISIVMSTIQKGVKQVLTNPSSLRNFRKHKQGTKFVRTLVLSALENKKDILSLIMKYVSFTK